MEAPLSPTLLDETSAGLTDNPFTEDLEQIEDEAFSDSSLSSCLDEDESDLQKDTKGKSNRLHKIIRPIMASSQMEFEIVTRRRVIRRRISRPSPLPSLYQASLNSQEAISGSGISIFG